jgi:SAM-dependent methyltransferase
MPSQRIDACRSCGGSELRPFLDLGLMPLSDGLRYPEQLDQPEPKYPLEVAFCESCGYVQILDDVPPEELFGDDYPYFSSFSDHLLKHSKANVDRILAERKLGKDSLAIELASNDGYLLQYFQQAGVPVLGIDPAAGPVKAAREKGIETRHAFFTEALADELVAQGKRADVIVGNNVLAHVPDLAGFVGGIAKLLKPDGSTSIEAPYVRDLVDGCQFDTIYHEHLGYWSVTAAKALFERHGLHLNRVTHLDIHGGSIRYEASPTKNPDGSVERFLAEERERGIDRFDFYADFGKRVAKLQKDVHDLVSKLKAEGRSIAAYGAAAKGAILVNACGLDESLLDFVVDRNVHKQGRFMPGIRVEILDPEVMLERQPDDVLILPWNFEQEIVRQQAEYLRRGGRFIVPVPEPRFVTHEDVA